jgi:polyisoprenoid-binding protein YceI
MWCYARYLLPVVIAGFLTSVAAAESYSLSGENTKIEFLGAKKDGTHTGGFKQLSGTATVNGADPTTLTIALTIDMNSLYSDNPKLTAHLKAPDFFEVKRFPNATFKSSGVTKSKEGYTVSGELTMHGQTKPLSFPAQITAGPGGLSLSSKFKLDRNEWGISYGKGMINDDVAMTISLKAGK